MRYEITVAPEAADDLSRLRPHIRSQVRDSMETHLRFEPTKTSKSRIKCLRGLSRPQYRLRIDDVRVFFDVSGDEVHVLAIVPKSEAEAWLRESGVPS